jgi:3-oxoacyl-[acyl-carrier-protein] synthase III
MATATLVARTDSQKYPVHFAIRYAGAEKREADGVFFDFQLRENVLLPTLDGGQDHVAQRLVFSLDGMGIADAAPRAMAGALAKALEATNVRPEEVRFVVPHQAGTGIVRFTGMKLEEFGIRGEVINGLTKNTGNVSSCSIPYALKRNWDRLQGTIACPTAAVGAPGVREVLQGCTLLAATPHHERVAKAAA